MRAVHVTRLSADLDDLRVVDLPDPRPARGEVLIDVRLAPVNPADLLMAQGTYVVRREPPFVPGATGVGTVVADGGGALGRLLRGRRVVFGVPAGRDGSWAQRVATPAGLCVPVPGRLADEDAMNLLANATTAVGLLDELERGRHRGVVVTAAGGELARLLARGAVRRGLAVLPVVRTERHAAALQQRPPVLPPLVSDRPDFAERLRRACAEHGVTAAVDAVAGPLTATLLDALPPRSTVWVVGRLSGRDTQLDVFDAVVGRQQVLRGFNVEAWLGARSAPGRLAAVRRARALVDGGDPARVAHRLTLDEAPAALARAVATTSAGKTVLVP